MKFSSITKFIAILLVFAFSCNEEEVSNDQRVVLDADADQGSIDGGNEPAEEQTLVTYASHVKTIVEENCVSCHDEEAAANAGKPESDFSSFEKARPYGSLMPSFEDFENILSVADQDIIKDWIDNGLTEADYIASAKAVIDENCVSCHPEGAEERALKGHTNFYSEEIVKLYGSQLPSFGKLKGVSSDEQLILERWVKDGLQ